MVAVITIYRTRIKHCRQRHATEQFFELREKWRLEIVFKSEFHRIPLVAPPCVPVVNYDLRIRREAGDDIFSGKRALPAVQIPFVPPHKSSLHPAFRAPRRRRNGNFGVKIEVLVFYMKLIAATFAQFFLHIHMPILPSTFEIGSGVMYYISSNLSSGPQILPRAPTAL